MTRPPDKDGAASGSERIDAVADAHAGVDAIGHCRTWLDWAATQVAASLAMDALARDQLLLAVAAVMKGAQASAVSSTAAQAGLADIVAAVQAHDRISQGLAHVEQALRSLREHLSEVRNAESAQAWQELGRRQYEVFSMPEERALFARTVGADGGTPAAAEALLAVELFDLALD